MTPISQNEPVAFVLNAGAFLYLFLARYSVQVKSLLVSRFAITSSASACILKILNHNDIVVIFNVLTGSNTAAKLLFSLSRLSSLHEQVVDLIVCLTGACGGRLLLRFVD